MAVLRALKFVCTVKYNEVTTLYSQNDVNQIGARATRDRARFLVHVRAPLPHVKLVTNGSGKVWPVDENGSPLVILRITPPSAHSKAFRQSKNGSNC